MLLRISRGWLAAAWLLCAAAPSLAAYNEPVTINGVPLLTIFPGASASVQGSGVPGLDGASWYIYSGNSDFSGNPTFTVDRRTYTGSGAYSQVYPTIKVKTYTGPSNAGFEWAVNAELAAYARASTNAENVAMNGTLRKVPYNDTVATTGASGDGTTATITFSGGATIPVGYSVKIAGVTPSGYNGTWKVTASSAGSVSYLNATTGAQTVAGTLLNVSTAYGAGGNFVCSLETGEQDPVKPCIGAEIDIYTNAATTDSNRNMVGAQIQAKGASGAHIGRGIFMATSGGVVLDRGIDWSGTFGTGIDFSSGTFSTAPIVLATNQKICMSADCTRYMTYNGSSLTYNVPGGQAFAVGDGGSVVMNRGVSNSGNDLKLTGTTGKITTIGVNGVDDVYKYDTAGHYPASNNARTSGASGAAWSQSYAYQYLTPANVPTISACGTSPPAPSGGSNAHGGQFTTGTGAPTACTVTFATAFPNNAFCTVTPTSNYTGTLYLSAMSKTGFTVTYSTGATSQSFSYTCSGAN